MLVFEFVTNVTLITNNRRNISLIALNCRELYDWELTMLRLRVFTIWSYIAHASRKTNELVCRISSRRRILLLLSSLL